MDFSRLVFHCLALHSNDVRKICSELKSEKLFLVMEALGLSMVTKRHC